MPWFNISTHTNGDLRLCCISDKFITKEDGSNFNLGYDKLEDIINSNTYKKIRSDMLAGKPIDGCSKCYKAEEHGGKSYRNYYNIACENNLQIKKKVEQSLTGNDIDNTIEYFDIRYGNLCNLSCRSCYPGASSQFDKDVKELLPTTNILKFHGWMDKDVNIWYTTDIFHDNFNSQLSNLKLYYTNGGEPTIIEKNIEILHHMIDTGVSKNITLQFNTNMTNTRKEFYELLPYFKKVLFLASIDGYDKMQEYLRYPSKWKQVASNLDKLVSMKLSNVEIKVNSVVSKYNLEHITELFEYVENINRKHGKCAIHLAPIVLMDPPYLDFEYLHKDYKMMCWDKIEKWIDESCEYQSDIFHPKIATIRGKCMTELNNSENLDRFFEFTDMFDTHRNQKLSDINPTLDAMRHK